MDDLYTFNTPGRSMGSLFVCYNKSDKNQKGSQIAGCQGSIQNLTQDIFLISEDIKEGAAR
jgi:hypothetical protein